MLEKLLKSCTPVASLFALAVLPAAASSFVINIQNPGFEDSTTFTETCCNITTPQVWNDSSPHWTVSDPNNTAGDYRPSLYRNPAYSMFLPAYEGLNVGFSNGGTLSQILSATAHRGVTYTMSVAVGRRGEMAGQTYDLGIYAGGVALGTFHGSTAGMLPTSWNVVTFTARNDNILGNQPLEIRLTAGGIQVDFDSISLFADTPEPGTLIMGASALLFLLALVAYRRRKLA